MINALKRLFRKPEQGPIDEGNDAHSDRVFKGDTVPADMYYIIRGELLSYVKRNAELTYDLDALRAKLSRSHQKRDAKGRFVKS